jgi:hypothetical protein
LQSAENEAQLARRTAVPEPTAQGDDWRLFLGATRPGRLIFLQHGDAGIQVSEAEEKALQDIAKSFSLRNLRGRRFGRVTIFSDGRDNHNVAPAQAAARRMKKNKK